MALFRPKQIIDRFDKLNIQDLKDRGFKAVFIDVDNTITLPDSGGLTDEAKKFIEDVKANGLIPIIFSNNTQARVKRFVGDYDIANVCWAMKPFPFSFWIIAAKYKISIKETVTLGDQLITDMLGANLSGSYGIYSKPLTKKDTPMTRFNRFFERIIWRIIDEEM